MAEEETVSGLRLLRAAATPALANYVNDHFAMIGFQAYLWKMVVTVDYGHGDPAKFPAPGEPAPPESAVGQMTNHSQYLNEMTFCRGVNSFQTYLAELLTLIFEARPETLKSQKLVTREFCVEHYAANDLIAALAKQTVDELAYRSLKDVARFFEKTLRLPLFTKREDLEKTALHVDIRNVITHNRGIVDTLFVQRHPEFSSELGHPISLKKDSDTGEQLGGLLFFARQLDLRAIQKFGLPTLLPQDGPQSTE
jgi:hypothetical protein